MLTKNEMKELDLLLEQEECRACGVEYHNFPIDDRGLPGDISRFKQFVEQIAARVKEGNSVAIHCRAGIGRSSLLLCSVLVRLGFTCNQAWGFSSGRAGLPCSGYFGAEGFCREIRQFGLNILGIDVPRAACTPQAFDTF